MPVKKSVQVAFRLPADLLERVDRYMERLGVEAPWANPNRADAVRALLARALDDVETEVTKGKAPKKRRGG